MIGIPYKHLGRDPKVGLDCWGCVIEFYKRVGVSLPDPISSYSRDWYKSDSYIWENQSKYFSVECFPAPSYIAVQKISAPVPNHLSVVIDHTYVLNSSDNFGVHFLRLFSIRKYIVNYLRIDALKIRDDLDTTIIPRNKA
jgi:cell wall-associated NlpC family hydrolase